MKRKTLKIQTDVNFINENSEAHVIISMPISSCFSLSIRDLKKYIKEQLQKYGITKRRWIILANFMPNFSLPYVYYRVYCRLKKTCPKEFLKLYYECGKRGENV